MASLVKQPTARPTNKLTSAMLAGGIIAIVRWAVPPLNDDALWVALTPIAILCVGWFVPDEANV